MRDDDGISLRFGELYIETFEGFRQPLTELTEWSHVHASVVFTIGRVDLARWATDNLEPSDSRSVRSWLEELIGLRRALREDEGQETFHSSAVSLAEVLRRPIASTISLRREGHAVVVRVDGHTSAKTSYAAFAAAVDAFIESVREAVEPLGEVGALWWGDTCDSTDPSWRALDDDAFHDKRGAWLYGPNFDVRLETKAPGQIPICLEALPGHEERPSLFGLGSHPRRIVPGPRGEDRVGFTCSPETGMLSFPSHQVVRACQLPDADVGALWPNGPCPTPEARAFIRWLVDLVQRIAQTCPIEHAVLMSEGGALPTCPLERGSIYAYAWAAIGEPTPDPTFNRIPLRRT